jgi:hypothetical protein
MFDLIWTLPVLGEIVKGESGDTAGIAGWIVCTLDTPTVDTSAHSTPVAVEVNT